jgi:hypothetical protein
MNTKHPTDFALQENISRNVVFIDGITRCGKSLFSNVIPTFLNTEQIQFIALLEHVVPALSLGAISAEYAKSSMRSLMNELAYNMLIARNVNFRPSDQTGVLNHPNGKEYFTRLSKDDGDGVVEELRKHDRLFPFMTHDMMVNLEYLDLLEIDYKMIHIYRHPIDNIYSWFTRGWGERYQNDPRSFTLSIGCQEQVLPWYCAGYEEEWLALNPMERCIRTAADLIERSIVQHKKAANAHRIHALTFENFVENTETEMEKIHTFLGTQPTPWTNHFLTKARCPRILDSSDRSRKLQAFKEGVSEKLFERLEALSERYEKGVYGLLK